MAMKRLGGQPRDTKREENDNSSELSQLILSFIEKNDDKQDGFAVRDVMEGLNLVDTPYNLVDSYLWQLCTDKKEGDEIVEEAPLEKCPNENKFRLKKAG